MRPSDHHPPQRCVRPVSSIRNERVSGRGFSGVCRWTDGPCGVELNCELLSVPNRCKREKDERRRGPAGCNETKKPFRGGWMATVLVVLGWVVQLLVLVPFQIHIPWQHPFSWSVPLSCSAFGIYDDGSSSCSGHLPDYHLLPYQYHPLPCNLSSRRGCANLSNKF